MCQTATESISAKIDIDTNKGTQNLGIDFISYNSTGTEESIGYTIQASASIDGVIEYTGDIDFTKWVGVIFDANSNATRCVYNAADDGAGNNAFIDCVFKNATQDCWSVKGTAIWYTLRCEWTGAGRYGIAHSQANRGTIVVLGGSIHHNTDNGWHLNRTDCHIYGAEVYQNGGDGVAIQGNGGKLRMDFCTFYENTGDGLHINDGGGDSPIFITNSTFVNNGAWGVDVPSDGDRNPVFASDNHHFGNGNDGVAVAGALGSDLITGDPLFKSTTNNSEDFTPLANSPLAGAATNGRTIGARAADKPTVGFAI